MKYGDLPVNLGAFDVEFDEMMFYQYLPIKLINETNIVIEKRLHFLEKFIGKISCDYIGVYGLDNYVNSYMYLTIKHLYQQPNCPFNRAGWHSDGFMTNDINYIWSDCLPTIFNNSEFNLTQNDLLSLEEMELQAEPENNIIYNNKSILRLNQYNIHKVNEIEKPIKRKFIKISISKDKYDLKGNSINYELNYDWKYRNRLERRNIPQKI